MAVTTDESDPDVDFSAFEEDPDEQLDLEAFLACARVSFGLHEQPPHLAD